MSEEVKLTEKPMIGTSRQRIIPAKFEPSKGNNLEFTIDEFGNLFAHPENKMVIETWNGVEWVS